MFLPGGLPSTTLEANTLPVIILFPAGTFLMGTLLVREQRRIETDEALATERNLLRTLIDTMPDFVYVKDTQSRFVMANQPMLVAGGFSGFEPLAGKNDFDFFPAELAHQFYDDEQQVIQSGHMLVGKEEATVDLITGEPRWYSTTKVPLRDVHGQITGLLGISRNITERKTQEQALRDSEKRFRSLMESAPDAMVMVNQSGYIELVNSQTEHLFGYTREELAGQAIEMLIPEPFHSRHATHRDGYIADPRVRGMGVGLELYALRKDGSHLPVEISLSPIETAEGVLIASSVRDITERKRTEERLTAEHSLLHTLIDAIPDYIFVKDRGGRFILSNIAHAHAAQASDPDDLIGKTAAEVFPAELAAQFDADDQTILRSGASLISQERQSVDPVGKAVEVSTTKVPLRNLEGEVIGLVGISRDITASKLAKEQARELTQERDRVRILADFVGNISHDFRTPLAVINTSVDLLRKTSDPERQTQRMNLIEQQIKRMTEFLERLVVMTRLDSVVTLNFQPVSISQIARLVASLTQPLVHDKGVVLQVDAAPNLPLIQADSAELTQAVREIVKNAIWFTPSGGTVSVTTSVLDGQGVIQVRDTGIGIASTDLPRIFERLYRGDKARSSETGGFGLGLPIAKRILDLHGGTIEVESEKGIGSVFRLLLPLDR